MEKLKSLGEYEKNAGISILIGPKKKLPERVKPGKDLIIIGDCLKKYRGQGSFANGCPSLEPFPLWAIIDRRDHTDMGPDFRDRMAADAKAFDDYLAKILESRKRR
jgi:hypothetical protein